MRDTCVRVAVAGVGGRMGKQLAVSVLQTDGVMLGAALERKGSLLLGSDVGETIGIGKIGVIIQTSLNVIKEDFDIFIDFTHPEETLNHLAFCRQNGKAMVIGTTGLNDIGKRMIKEASKDIAIVFSANFSVGINVMLKLLEKVTRAMGDSADIEIIETHHRHKIDAPSGTALAMGETIANALNKDLRECAIYSRKEYTGKRAPGTIGFSAIRAGDITGEHTVMFAGVGERIEITHKSSSRTIFANGAILSAMWLKGKAKGLFDMSDVLELKYL